MPLSNLVVDANSGSAQPAQAKVPRRFYLVSRLANGASVPPSPSQRKRSGPPPRFHKAGLRATELTRQLLAFSRRQLLQPSVVALSTVLRGMENMLRRLVREA
ncbi:MAG: hypothetical protein LH466_07535, partial [Sphingomonas bacterium]|nr:hypothetical protein [Sphingomonas bacterium]